MKKNQFVHLHVHSEYSLLNGMCKIKDIANLAEEYGMPAVALTDHGNMAGVLEFYKHLNYDWIDVKPIIGCEIYLSPTNRFDKDHENVFHLILLAKDYTGYQNLCRLVSAGHLEGFYKKPRIDKQILSENSEGLLCLSGCIKGEVSLSILEDRMVDAKKKLNEYLDIFGRDNFYLELTDHGMPIQTKANNGLISLGKEFDVKVVATNDVHYMKQEDAKSHDLLRCMKNNTTNNDADRYIFSGDQYYFKTADEMAASFADIPEALTNTLEVAEKCNLKIPIAPEINRYPVYEMQSDLTRKEYLRDLCMKGIKERYGFGAEEKGSQIDQQEIIARIDYELDLFDRENYCSYFLILWDIVKYAKEKDIPVGPGRGSAGGSMICYLLGITDIDPIRFDLVFERFFNPERISPPDVDLDFCQNRRSEILDYIFEKYGYDKTAFISVYPEFRGRSMIKSILKAMGRPPSDWLKISEKVSEDTYCRYIRRTVDESPALQKMLENEQWAKELYEYAVSIEGLKREREMHAAGIIIGDKKLSNIMPMYKEEGRSITQFNLHECEENGLMPLDILGLKTLTQIQQTVEKIRVKNKGFRINDIPLDDKKTFALLNSGETEGVFQFESQGMRELCSDLGVSRIEDIIAIIALYRPGLIQFIPEFIERKKGKIDIEYEDPRMEPILKETYGIILYQEQMIQILQIIGGLSPGHSDLCRRALGKKKIKDMEMWHSKFMEGCKTDSISVKTADAIWVKLVEFAGYGFNKSHSVAYALIAFRTAYLKANYYN